MPGSGDCAKVRKSSPTSSRLWLAGRRDWLLGGLYLPSPVETYPLAFDRTRGILIVEAPDPLTAEVLAHRFHTTIMRAVHNLHLALDDVPVQDIQFQSRR